MIAISLSPNAQADDVFLALKILLTPWRWMRGSAIKSLEDWFRRYFQVGYAVSFDSGRSALYALVKALGIKSNDEILMQAFTCVAVPNSIIWAGAKPIFVDVDDVGNIDIADLKKKITRRSRAIIIQHTFGISANMEKIKKVASKHKLIVIEDCAHALGATAGGKKIGTFGEAAFFSFGRDKVISSVSGGMVITNSKKTAKLLRNFQKNLQFTSLTKIFTQLFHPIAFSFILPLYNTIGIGKIILIVFQKLGFLDKPVAKEEYQGERPAFLPSKLSCAQSLLAGNQVKKLAAFNKKRRQIAEFYSKKLSSLPIKLPQFDSGDIILRYNIETGNVSSIYSFFKEKGILLGRWYANIIDPEGVNLAKIGYTPGSCPKAEALARASLNLPTYPRMNIKETMQEYFKKNG
ncbi:aminotransferase class I/II-fold pyridoxal phosphate-dependent enzyme [Candidatus Microgenomates bacterium]|nr:aminotransferase class I/II-fold pyridoxal phosphate-dependent enzyme [Candidatus Microgenomates bacterium]